MCSFSIFCSETFWTAFGSIIAGLGLGFIWYQIRATKKVSAADFLLKLDQEFNGKFTKYRKKLADDIKQKNSEIDFKIPDFFETIGLLLRHKVVPVEFVWQIFGDWVKNYWILIEPYIKEVRKKTKDETFYTEFEYLNTRMTEIDKKKKILRYWGL